jgi:tripartite-type tricarboxylate transporter receptor subunit TctC
MLKFFRPATLAILWCVSATFFPIGGAIAAGEWAQRPVTLIVSQPGGASPDVMARMLAERITANTGQAMIIENKPGAGNAIGATAAARAIPDGTTLYFATSAALVLNPFLMANLTYDPMTSFTPVAFIAKSNQLIVTKASTPAANLAELVALEKRQSGKLSIAVDGPRNLAGLIALALNQKAKTNFVLVPYNNITSGVQDVMAGRVEAGVFSVSIVESLIREGSLKALAAVADAPISSMPEVPLAKETVEGLDYSGWFMVLAPAGTPKNTINVINAAFKAAVADPKLRELAPKLGFELSPTEVGSPEQAAEILKAEYGAWKTVIDQLGLKPQ